MNDHPNDEFDELMRRAMAEEADRIEPADGLHEIQARVRTQRKPVGRRPWAITAGAAVLGTAAAIGAFSVLNDNTKTADEPSIAGGPDTTTTASADPSSSTTPTRPPTPKPAPTKAATQPPTVEPSDRARATEQPVVKQEAVPVYWLGKVVGNTNGPDYRLYRTWQSINGRPAEEAVRLMTMSKAAGDPDYVSPWDGAAVNSVRYTDDLITVDFKQLPEASLEPDMADVAAQQLVYTVQGALHKTKPVQITEQGRIPSNLFGVIDANNPLNRAQALNVQAMVWIETPANNQTVGQPFKVTGTAAAYEAQVDWKATNLKTKVVVKNYTKTAEGQKFSAYGFTPKLDSGEWLIEVYLTSPEDGRVTDTDSKTVYVK
jgi:immunoglobulin-like protein involved in spore germination